MPGVMSSSIVDGDTDSGYTSIGQDTRYHTYVNMKIDTCSSSDDTPPALPPRVKSHVSNMPGYYEKIRDHDDRGRGYHRVSGNDSFIQELC